jgi:hypothetical protein
MTTRKVHDCDTLPYWRSEDDYNNRNKKSAFLSKELIAEWLPEPLPFFVLLCLNTSKVMSQ